MGIFSRKSKDMRSSEFEELIKKITSQTARIEELENKIKIFETNLNSLRGLVNRKLGNEPKEEDPTGLNNPVILPYNGSFR